MGVCEESGAGEGLIGGVKCSGGFRKPAQRTCDAARCEDSLSVRAFLGYGLEESTPITAVERDSAAAGARDLQGVFEVVLAALKAQGLFRGRHLGSIRA